jgi:hypothetical protein
MTPEESRLRRSSQPTLSPPVCLLNPAVSYPLRLSLTHLSSGRACCRLPSQTKLLQLSLPEHAVIYPLRRNSSTASTIIAVIYRLRRRWWSSYQPHCRLPLSQSEAVVAVAYRRVGAAQPPKTRPIVSPREEYCLGNWLAKTIKKGSERD